MILKVYRLHIGIYCFQKLIKYSLFFKKRLSDCFFIYLSLNFISYNNKTFQILVYMLIYFVVFI